MGLFDKLKGALNAVTGGAAKVTIELAEDRGIGFVVIYPGEAVWAKVTATSTGGEVRSKGAFIDVRAVEEAVFRDPQSKEETTQSETMLESSFQIGTDFVLGPNQTEVFTGTFVLPSTVPPSYEGRIVRTRCFVRGRIEAFGNDPDSGYVPVKVGSR